MDFEAPIALLAPRNRELWVVTARAGSRTGGLIATFVNSASIVPELPRVLIGVARQHYTWELIEASDAFALNLLGTENLPWIRRFGLQSGRDFDKLAGVKTESSVTGSPLLADALGWLDCRVEARLEIGSRTIYLAEVVDARIRSHEDPLTVLQLLCKLPAKESKELGQQMLHDAAVEAEAIRAWRGRQRDGSPRRQSGE